MPETQTAAVALEGTDGCGVGGDGDSAAGILSADTAKGSQNPLLQLRYRFTLRADAAANVGKLDAVAVREILLQILEAMAFPGARMDLPQILLGNYGDIHKVCQGFAGVEGSG